MPLPEDFYDDDAMYSLRVCMTVEEAPLIGLVTGSKVHQCDNCGDPIWVREDQPIPNHPDGIPWTGAVICCTACAKTLIEADDDPTWMGPKPANWP